MIVYNITIKIDRAIEKEWLEWQFNEHIPEIMNTGMFLNYNFYRLLEQDDSEGLTFVLQYHAATIENYNTYISKFAPALREKANRRWKDGFIAFRTIMESLPRAGSA